MTARDGAVRLLFGTEERAFRLTVTRWEKVQDATKAGPPEIARRLGLAMRRVGDVPPLQVAAAGLLGQWNVQDVRAPLLHGLIGGGMAEEHAEKLCRELVDDRPLMLCVPTAFEVVMASLYGPPEEPLLGETEGATPQKTPRRSRTSRSATPKSGASPKR